MSLPPLPPTSTFQRFDGGKTIQAHTSADMREYGALCRHQALEEAVQVCDEVQAMYGQYTFSAQVAAERIRKILNH